jgi:pimeloyl-ACP methyl ester carboxylesterase
MSETIVFIHGAWMTPLCWEPFSRYFQLKGYECVAPAWPYHDRPVEELRAHPAPELAGLGMREIADSYARIITAMDEPPILIGHSFGGLIVQLLLDRGLGAAGVAIDSAPPRSVLPLGWTGLRANAPVLLRPGAWHQVVSLTFPAFRYAFVHTLPEAEQKAAYARHVVPESGRVFFQTALASLRPGAPTRVNFRNRRRAPLLLVAGGRDHIVPARWNRVNYRKYRKHRMTQEGYGPAHVEFVLFRDRTHWLIADARAQEVANFVEEWLERVPRGIADDTPGAPGLRRQ